MIRYLIIDDEYIAHDIIKGYCDLLPNMQLAKNCYDALEAIEYFSSHEVDLIFLDLNMPVLQGFDFLKTLHHPPKVIVTTAYQEFALEGYEQDIVDYLLKPFGFERFLKAINKAFSHTDSKIKNVESSNNTSRRIFVQSNKKYIQIEVGDIYFIEATGNYTKIITPTETIVIREKFSKFLESIIDDEFIQVHKSFAIAVKQINSIEGNVITIGNHKIPIGKNYKSNITKLLR